MNHICCIRPDLFYAGPNSLETWRHCDACDVERMVDIFKRANSTTKYHTLNIRCFDKNEADEKIRYAKHLLPSVNITTSYMKFPVKA